MLRRKKPATFAFLDLDNTLINTAATELNQSLLDALKEQGIRDLCLFTSMDNTQIRNDLTVKDVKFTRPEIIKELEKQGFVVHRVITPSDLYQEKAKPGEYYKKKWLPAFKKAKKMKDEENNFERISELTKNVDNDIQEYKTQVENQARYIASLGKNREQSRKQAEEYISKYKDNKGDMYQLACENLDAISIRNDTTVGSIVFFDDNFDEIKHVSKKNKEMGYPIPLTCIEVLTKNTSTKQESDITASDKVSVKARYTNELNSHQAMLKKMTSTESILRDQLHKNNITKDTINKFILDVRKLPGEPIYEKLLEEICTQHPAVWMALVEEAAKKKMDENLLGYQYILNLLNDVKTMPESEVISKWEEFYSDFLSEQSTKTLNLKDLSNLREINKFIKKNEELPPNFKEVLTSRLKEISSDIHTNKGEYPLFNEIYDFKASLIHFPKKQAALQQQKTTSQSNASIASQTTTTLSTQSTTTKTQSATNSSSSFPTTPKKGGVDIVMSTTTRAAFIDYLNSIKKAVAEGKISLDGNYKPEWQKTIGKRLFEILKNYLITKNKNINDIDENHLIKFLFKTTMHEIYPERLDINKKGEIEAGAETTEKEWNSTEHYLLANSPKIIRKVTPFTKDTYDPTSLLSDEELNKVKDKLDFVLFNGPLISEYNPREFDRCFSDASIVKALRKISDEIYQLKQDAEKVKDDPGKSAEIKEKETKLIAAREKIIASAMKKFDFPSYKQLIKERILPGLLLLNSENKEGFIFTTPALGCQAYAGSFSGRIHDKFIQALQEIIAENKQNLNHLKGVVLAGLEKQQPYYEDRDISGIPFIITNKGIGTAPQLDAHVKDKIKECEKYRVVVGVAGDVYSNAGNEFHKFKGGSQEAAVFQQTNALERSTGIDGEKHIEKGDMRRKWSNIKLMVQEVGQEIGKNILEKAKENKTPLIIKEDNHFKIYGDPKGDGNWKFTKIDSKNTNQLKALPFDKDATLMFTNKQLYTDQLFEILKTGHAPQKDKLIGYKPKKSNPNEEYKPWSQCYAEGTVVNHTFNPGNEKTLKNFLDTLKEFLDDHMAHLQKHTFTGSATILKYQEILNSNKPTDHQVMELLTIAKNAAYKREKSNTAFTLFKHTGDRVIISKFHNLIAHADFNLKDSTKQIAEMSKNFRKDNVRITQDLVGEIFSHGSNQKKIKS